MPSARTDTHGFLADVAARGAAAALVHSEAGFAQALALGMAAVLVSLAPEVGESEEERIRSSRGRFYEALWRVASVVFERPSSRLKVAAITGTNGKTSTAWLMADGLSALETPSAYLGTLGLGIGPHLTELPNTTPFSVELNELLRQVADAEVRALALEVSSHALAERRSDGLEVDVALFTNFTQDHLNYHRDMEAYKAAKWRLFAEYPQFSDKEMIGVFNGDDPVGREFAERYHGRKLTYGKAPNCDLRWMGGSVGLTASRIELAFGSERAEAEAHLGGAYNQYNLTAAVAGMVAMGFGLSEAVSALPKMRPVPGRFEAVPNDSGIAAIVDYAHTPDALEKLLDGVRALTTGEVLVVFGCGGDRDRGKRPQMGRIAGEKADYVFVTSDNPRTEDPHAIITEIIEGMPRVRYAREPDRARAVRLAFAMAKPGDCVVIAGKGHENYQIVGHEKTHMDDHELVREAVNAL